MAGVTAAVIGTGMIGHVHARAVKASGARLRVVVDPDTAKAERAAAELGADTWRASASDVMGDAEVDVVHICVPNHLHGDLVRMALRAGKHVICEKPLATTVHEARELADLAAEAGVMTAVPFANRFYAPVRDARSRVRSGEVGDLRLLYGHYLQDWLVEPTAYSWRVDDKLGGASRAFGDIGSHLCDLVEFVSGHRIVDLVADTQVAVPVRFASASAETFSGAQEGGVETPVTTEDIASVLFRTDGGAVGVLVLSQVSPGRKNHLWLELDGSRQSVIFDQDEPERLVVGGAEGMWIRPRDPQLLSPEACRYSLLPAGHAQGLQDCFNALVADAYAVMGGAVDDTLPTFADGLRAAVITEAVLESARSRSWVSVPG